MRIISIAVVLAVATLSTASLQTIPHDLGAAGAWQKILKVKTTASVMHTTAHPDDEHGGVITRLSRLDGARLALTTLNRGESGDNAIGPQLFDGLGLIRTEELIDAGRYYGVDSQYFTTVIDYGFSKRLEEAFDKWGRDNVLRDLVRIIRMDRPWVLLSRFQGNARDGHGNHQTAGLLTQLAFKAAGDPQQFPEQIAEGLRPWQPFKVYMGGVRGNEDFTVGIDAGEYSPWLGESYDNLARFGLSFQRSQNSGRYNPSPGGPNAGLYKRVGERITAPLKESSIWDGIDTTYAGLFKMLGRTAPADVEMQLAGIDRAVARAMREFMMVDPSKAAPGLAEGLTLTREVMGKSAQEPEVLQLLQIKERQFQDAITAALGIGLTATAGPKGIPEQDNPFSPPPSLSAPVPGQTFDVRVFLGNKGNATVETPATMLTLDAAPGWRVSRNPNAGSSLSLPRHSLRGGIFTVTLADDVSLSTRPYFSRTGLAESRYTLSDPAQFGRAAAPPPLVAVARYTIEGVPVEIRETVRRREPKLPYGDVLREVRSVPRLAVTVSPSSAIVPLAVREPIGRSSIQEPRRLDVEVSLLHNAEAATSGQVTLKLPAGWTVEPSSYAFSFARAGERAAYRFTVRPGSIGADIYKIDAVASAGDKEYREGYEIIDQRDLEIRYLYRASTVDVRGVNVITVPGLKVGYVMGIGDSVPLGLQQLSAQVTLLGERELASLDLSTFDAIVTGTRAYAVRDDLKTYNRRLLDYVKAGGNMIVLYNTQELVPAQFAPFPGELPRNAEEVSEEDSPVEILAPTHQAFTWPNKISAADFDGWVEQRGSKFFTTWDAAYTPMIATYDKGQPPQRGGWLTAKVGKGTWTYFAYALHRQLPYSVPGAYRITANLLALGKTPR